MNARPFLLALAGSLLLLVAACSKPEPQPAADPGIPPAGLAGTSWQLYEIRPTDPAAGVIAPADPSKYQMVLHEDGTVSMTLDCNSASGTWTALASDAGSGSFTFGPLAMTRAFCPPPSLSDQIAGDTGAVASYEMVEGKLSLRLAVGGSYLWEPM